jgi:hypothetical protein
MLSAQEWSSLVVWGLLAWVKAFAPAPFAFWVVTWLLWRMEVALLQETLALVLSRSQPGLVLEEAAGSGPVLLGLRSMKAVPGPVCHSLHCLGVGGMLLSRSGASGSESIAGLFWAYQGWSLCGPCPPYAMIHSSLCPC